MHTRRKPPRFALNTVFAATLACYAPLAQANPAGAEVVAGNAQLQQQGNSLVISNTPGTIINWQSFSIQPHELTRFVQQSAQSAVLNRVVGQDPSQILGQLQSNGQVFLINPNGVVFGQGAQVDVAGLLASTLNISDADFQAGKLRLSGTTTASVSNAASISTPSGGFVYLIAPNVHNHGVIVSPQGEILLAAGQSVELVDGVDTSLRVKIAAPAGEVLNVGQLIASQGRIGIFATAIQQQGLVSANRAELGEGGRIVFKASRDVQLASASLTEAQGGGSVVVDAGQRADVLGQLDVAHQTGKGGQITVLGEQVKVDGQLDASGATGGGTILIGGDYQGKNTAIRNAQFTELGSQARLDASAGQQGDGGKIIVWADQDTAAHGQIRARGGVLGGNGGFAEVSGKRHLQFQTAVDLSAPKGQIGKLLLDPTDFIIDSTNVAALFGASADVTLAATQDVIFDASAGSASTFYNISVQADRDISLQSGATLSSTGGNINLNAGRDVLSLGAINASGDLQISAGHNVQNEAAFSAGGVLQIRAGNDIVQNALFSSNGNTLNLFANDSALCAAYGCVGTLSLNYDVTTTGLLALSGKGIAQNGGRIDAGAGTVTVTTGDSGFTQSGETEVIADRVEVSSTGNVSLGNLRANDGTVTLQATSNDRLGTQLNVHANGSDLLITGDGITWGGDVELGVTNGRIGQNLTAADGKIHAGHLNLQVTSSAGLTADVTLNGSDNRIGKLSGQMLCPTTGCATAALDVRNNGELVIAGGGILNEYGDVLLGSSGKIHLDNAGIETSNSGSGIYLYSTTSTLTGSGANAVLRSDLINLQRDVAGNGYAGAIGTAAPDEALQLANRSGGEAISLYLGGSGASVAGAHIVSSDYLTVSSLNLGSDQTLFLQSADGMNLQNAGPINTGTADLSLHALGGELLLTSYSSMAGKNISLKSNGGLVVSNLSINALDTLAIDAATLSLMTGEGITSLTAGNQLAITTDALDLNSTPPAFAMMAAMVEGSTAPLQAPKFSLQTRSAGTRIDLGGVDGEGVLGLSIDELGSINTDLLELKATGADASLTVSADYNHAGNLNLQAGGGIQLDANLSADQLTLKSDSASIQGAGTVTATGELVLNAAQGIFGADSGLRVSAQTIKARSSQDGQGAIDLETDTPAVLDLQTANSQISVTALNGAELTLQQIQAGSGAVSLSTDGNLLAVAAGVSIKGGDLLLSAGSIGSAAQRLETDASGKFEVRTSTGSSYVSELGGASAHILRSDGDLDLVLGGNVLLDDQSLLGTASNLRLEVGGNLSLLRANAFSAGSLNLSSTGAINSNALLQALNGPLQLSAQSIGAPAARVALSGATQTVSSTGNGALYLESNGGSLNLNSQGGLIDLLAMGDAQLTVQSNGGNVSIDGNAAAASLGGLIDAGGGMISLLTSGRLGDATQTDGRLRVLGASVNATAVDLYLDSQKNGAQLQLSATGGDLDVLAADGSQLAASSSADMRLQSNGTLQLGGLDASQGTLSVSATRINGTAGQSAKAADILLQATNGIGALNQALAVDASQLEASVSGSGKAIYLQSQGGNAKLSSQGGAISLIAQSGNTQLDLLQSQGGAIQVQTLAGDLSLTSVQAGTGSVQLDSSGALSLGSLDSVGAQLKAGGALSYSGTVNAGSGLLGLTAGGAISSSGGLLKASNIRLEAVQGIGAGNALAVDSSQLSAHTTGSNAAIALNSQGGSAQLSTQDGDISLNSSTGSQVSASVGGQGRNLTVQAQSGDLQLQSLSVSGLAQLHALQGSLSGQSGTAWQAGQFALKAGQLNLNTDLNSSGSLMLDSLGAINAQGGRLTGSQITLRAAGLIGGANALQINTTSLDAASSLAGAGIQLSGTAATAKLSSQGGDISWQAQGASQVTANAGSGAIKASSDVALDGNFSAGSVQLSAQRLGSAAQRLQLDTLSADLQAAGELYADGSQRLASLQVSNSGSLTDFSGGGSYSATISSASNVVLHSGADIGLRSLNAKQVKLTALGSIQGLAGQAKQLVADTASLQAGGDIRLSSQVASLDLKAGANIDLVNHQALTLSGAQAGQDLRVESFGGLSTTGLVKSGGKLTLLTHSPLQIGSAGLEAGGDLLLQTVSSGANDEITLNGNLNVLGNCEIQSAGGIQQNAGISTQGGSLLLNAAEGDLLMSAAASSQSNGGAIRYSALGNLTLALLDAGTGAVDLLASQGSISSALPGGMNVRAGALNAKAGGGILLRANVPADKLTLSSGSGVLDVRDASGAPYPGTTPVDESEQIGNESVQAVSILTALGNTQPSVQDQVEQLMNAVEQQGQDKDQPKKARKC
ncbi:two-partner secretion domain-containing protein [Chitinimonas taiwanensis]|uniref:two-partner secretion domain-containing protein n=1 Tax=Chitinimonas taiwanensis TaxID=240412 RepID=UPI0035B04516